MPTSLLLGRISYPEESTVVSMRHAEWFERIAYLGCHELGCTTECACSRPVPHVFLAKPVISDLDMAIQCQEDVVKL